MNNFESLPMGACVFDIVANARFIGYVNKVMSKGTYLTNKRKFVEIHKDANQAIAEEFYGEHVMYECPDQIMFGAISTMLDKLKKGDATTLRFTSLTCQFTNFEHWQAASISIMPDCTISENHFTSNSRCSFDWSFEKDGVIGTGRAFGPNNICVSDVEFVRTEDSYRVNGKVDVDYSFWHKDAFTTDGAGYLGLTNTISDDMKNKVHRDAYKVFDRINDEDFIGVFMPYSVGTDPCGSSFNRQMVMMESGIT